MSNYNYNEGKTPRQIKATKIFKKWFNSDGICQFKYRGNRKTNYFIKYPVYTDDYGTSSLDKNIGELLKPTEDIIYYKVPRKALDDIEIDYYIDFVCSREGQPLYGFIIVDNDTLQEDLELIQDSSSNSPDFRLYAINAEWVISRANKPDKIVSKRIIFNI